MHAGVTFARLQVGFFLLAGGPQAWCAQAPGDAGSVAGKLAELAAAQSDLQPREGRWTIVQRERHRPATEEVTVWEGEGPVNTEAVGAFVTVPRWLPLVITARAVGLVDAAGEPYSGPLMAQAIGECDVAGPYPEGFVCAVDGACEATIVPRFGVFTDATIGLAIRWRAPDVVLELQDGPFPPSPDFYLSLGPRREAVLWSGTIRFGGLDHESRDAFAMSPVAASTEGDRCVLTAEARFSMAGGEPARKLPVRYQWFLDRTDGQTEAETVHEGVTDDEGRAADSLEVPAGAVKGRIRFWYHEQGDDFAPAAAKEFAFDAPGADARP